MADSGAITEDRVVAAGLGPNMIQLPSPIYIVQHISPTHVVLGAGGGGRRFGMANVLVIIETKALPVGPSKTVNPLWKYETALDVGDEVPWCATTFLPVTAIVEVAQSSVVTPYEEKIMQYQSEKGLIGLLAVSGATMVKLIGIFQDKEKKFHMQLFCEVILPNDEMNPDKKPLGFSTTTLTVAHDENEVFVYYLDDLIPPPQKKECVMEASPIGKWELPSRVNDLSVSPIQIVAVNSKKSSTSVSREATPSKEGSAAEKVSVKARVYTHLIVCASLQNKTVSVASLELDVKRGKKKDEPLPAPLIQQLAMDSAALRCSFKFMASSVRIVRLFGLGSVTSKSQSAVRDTLTMRALKRSGTPSKELLAKVMFVVYDAMGGQSLLQWFDLHGALESVENSSGKAKRVLRLTSQVHLPPSPILKDAITTISYPSPQSLSPADPTCPSLPPVLLGGTVEGTLCWIKQRYEKVMDGTSSKTQLVFQLDKSRPSAVHREAKKHPALHREPISNLSLHFTSQTIVSADIAQNVILSYLPNNTVLASQTKNAVAGLPFVVFPPETSMWADLLLPQNRSILMVAFVVVLLLAFLIKLLF
ncbi:hypothetical protein, conserved [Angomonas deanei]|uniref:Uncharacterized protein n=1 Tax=Angomonas deanei TaxID=59799 RepID=A0A7G2CGR3_9TRYP|nr:hypothetical protein, conserved [Angomonas deanei]